MVFSPKLEGGVAYNQPVQQPNAMGAIADLFNFGAKSLMGDAEERARNVPKPTEDEKFGASVRAFEADNSIGGTADWNNNLMRKFIFQYPEHDPAKIKGYAGGIGVQTETPLEVARDAAVEWFKTPEGMTAVAATTNMEPAERDAELSRRVTVVKQQEAELAKLQRDTAILEAEGTLDTARWDILKPTSKNMVDDTVTTILQPIVDEVMAGVSVELTPQEQEMLGVRYDKISMENLPAVLRDTKMFLENQARSSFQGNYGEDQIPPEAWNKEVFASLNSLITIGESIDTPVERAATMKALIDAKMYQTLDDNGVAVVARLAEVIPADTLQRLIPDMAGFDKRFMKALAGDGKVFTTAEIATNAANMSTSEADTAAKNAITLIEKHLNPEFFTLFQEAAKRSGHEVVDGPTYNAIIEGNVDEIKKLSTSSPDFRKRFSGFLVEDINKTVSTIKSNLIAGVNLTFDGKKFVLTPEPGTLAEQKWNDSYRPYSESVKNQLPAGLNVDVLNEKIGSLGLIGDVGKEVQEAIGILNQPEKTATKETTARGKGRGRGKVVPQDVIGGLQGRGIPTHIAEGFAMNIQDESAFNTSVNEASPTVPGSRGGFGLIQWTGPRRKGLEAFAEAQGKPADDLDVQLDFLVQELGGTESAAWARISAASTKEEAAALILNEFLRPAESHRASREAKYLGGAGGFEARSGTTGEPSGEAPVLSLDSGASEVPQGRDGASTALPARLEGNLISFDSPEVQQLVAQSQTNPEETVKAAKELLAGKPMDPQVKALIEALVRIGERA